MVVVCLSSINFFLSAPYFPLFFYRNTFCSSFPPLSVSSSVCQSVCHGVFLLVCLFLPLSVCPSVFFSICLVVSLSAHLFVCLLLCLSVQSVSLSVCLVSCPFCMTVFFPSFFLFRSLSVCCPVSLSFCLFVCLPSSVCLLPSSSSVCSTVPVNCLSYVDSLLVLLPFCF